MEYKAISSVSHIYEPADLWVTRLPSKLRERGPHVVDLDNGGQGWIIEDLKDPISLDVGNAGAFDRRGCPFAAEDLVCEENLYPIDCAFLEGRGEQAAAAFDDCADHPALAQIAEDFRPPQ